MSHEDILTTPSVQFPALTAIPGHQTNQPRLPADHPIGMTIGITFGSRMPESVVPGLMQIGLLPARISQLFNLKHNISFESEIKVCAANRLVQKRRKIIGIASPHDATDPSVFLRRILCPASHLGAPWDMASRHEPWRGKAPKSIPLHSFTLWLNIALHEKSLMSSSTSAQDQWYQEAAASQIKGERLTRAELLNGRVAMLGFVVGVLTEALTGHGIVSQITFGVLGLG